MAFNLTLLLCDNMLVSSTTLAAEIFNFAQLLPALTVKIAKRLIFTGLALMAIQLRHPRALSYTQPIR